MKIFIFVAFIITLSEYCFSFPSQGNPDIQHSHKREVTNQNRAKEDAAYWNQVGQQILAEHRANRPIEKQAKNIIIFLGDGMSVPTITASRIYKGQHFLNMPGEETILEFERFPYIGLSKTYCINYQVGDSACTATAYLTGVKANLDTVGVDINVNFGNCTAQNVEEYHVDSVMKWAQDAGKATGIVTTTRVTHATPAGTYAHIANRDWESDADILSDGEDTDVCSDIAEQLVYKEPGNKFKVVLGGGRSKFLPNTTPDPEGGVGSRKDGVNLIEVWKESKASEGVNSAYVTTQEELLSVDTENTDCLLGLFSSGHLDYHLKSDGKQDPTLEEMTTTAIKMLQKETNGYVLLVEGGRIDTAHHEGTPHLSLDETIELEKAVAAARQLANIDDTLIIVTSDHSHTMTINGYPLRGDSIFGIGYISDIDYLPWTTLSYANGPGYRPANSDGSRYDVTQDDMDSIDYKPIATAPTNSETHGGDDVAVFAVGPQAHMLQGVYEQNYIAHVMGYAACIGPGSHFCDFQKSSAVSFNTVGIFTLFTSYLILIFHLI